MALPTGTVTFLFTDIEGSTKLWEARPDAMRVALAQHDSVMRSAIELNGGHVFKTVGDAFCAAFHSASDGLNAALQANMALQIQEWAETGPLRVRMGLHTGAAEERDNDYFGPTLNRTARLQGVACGEQILLSQAMYVVVANNLSEGCSLRDLGMHRLKDLSAPDRVWQLQHPGIRADFPPLKSLDYLPTNLPRQLTSFVGRETEMARIEDLLHKSSLLTLTGSGGCGKTRLSLQVGASVLELYPDGVWFVELAPISDPALVPQTIAQALSIRESPGEPITHTLLFALIDKQMLLVLDNCEHVLLASARLVDSILRGCSKVKVLVSSREPLGIGGEVLYRVPSMSVPELNRAYTPESLNYYEAVRLFADRAAAVKPDFAISSNNSRALASVCHRLDGIPLAIELAAARVWAMPVEDINDRLDQRFRLLTGGSRTALPRQQTLRAMIDWSYDLLEENQKALLCRLSVFMGGWTLAAAEAVCSGDLFPLLSTLFADDVLDLLTSLVDKSLVVYEELMGKGRYRLLETVRQYALGRLDERGERNSVRQFHLVHFLALAEEAETELSGPDQVDWLHRLDEEHENLRSALNWSLQESEEGGENSREERRRGDGETGRQAEPGMGESPTPYFLPSTALLLCAALWKFWWIRGQYSEGRQWCDQALETAGAQERTVQRANVLNGAGNLAQHQGDTSAARSYHEQSLKIRREIGDRRGIGASLNNLGNAANDVGDYASARSYYEESLIIQREIGNQDGIAKLLKNRGIIAYHQGDYSYAHSLYDESLEIFRKIGDREGTALLLNWRGLLAWSQGDYDSSGTCHEESLSIHREIGNRSGIANSLLNLGNIAIDQRNYGSARDYYQQSLEIEKEIGHRNSIALPLMCLGNVAREESDYASARAFYAESITLCREIGDRRLIAYGLEAFASLADRKRYFTHAVMLWGAADRLREQIGLPVPPNGKEKYDRDVAELKLVLGDERFSTAWKHGCSLTVVQAIDLALESSTE